MGPERPKHESSSPQPIFQYSILEEISATSCLTLDGNGRIKAQNIYNLNKCLLTCSPQTLRELL